MESTLTRRTNVSPAALTVMSAKMLPVNVPHALPIMVLTWKTGRTVLLVLWRSVSSKIYPLHPLVASPQPTLPLEWFLHMLLPQLVWIGATLESSDRSTTKDNAAVATRSPLQIQLNQ